MPEKPGVVPTMPSPSWTQGIVGAIQRLTGGAEAAFTATAQAVAPSPTRQTLATAYTTWKTLQGAATVGDNTSARMFAWQMEPYVRDNPDFLDFLTRDLGSAIFTLESQQIADRLNLNVDLLDKVMGATDQQLSELRSQFTAAEQVLRGDEARTEAMHSLSVESLPIPDALKRLETLGPSKLAKMAALLESGGWTDEDQVNLAGNLLETLDGRTLNWVATPDRLTASVSVADGDRAGDYVIDLNLSHPIGGTSMDAVGAIVEALWGTDHEIRRVDDIPGGKTFMGTVNEFLGEITRPMWWAKDRIDAPLNWTLSALTFGGSDTTAFRTTATLRAEEEASRVAQNHADVLANWRTTDLDLLATAAAGLSLDTGTDPFTASVQTNMWWDTLAPDEQGRIRDEFQAGSAQQVEDALLEFKDNRHQVKRALDAVTATAMTGISAWEAFAQSNIISLVDFLGDTAQGFMRIPSEGFAAFNDVYEAQAYGPAIRGEMNLADYVHMDQTNPWYGFVNVAGSIAGDPLTWLTAGGAMMRKDMTRMLATPAGVEELLGKGRFQPFLRSLGEAQTLAMNGEGSQAVTAMLYRTGISRDGLKAISRGDDLKSVLRSEMTTGNMIPSLTGGFKQRGSAQWIARMSAHGNEQVQKWFKYMFGQFPSDRRISLSERHFFDDGMGALLARSAQGTWAEDEKLFAKWSQRLMDITDPATDGAKGWVLAKSQSLTEQAARLRTDTAGMQRILAEETQARQAGDRLFRLTAAPTDTAALGDAYRVAEENWIRLQTPQAKAAYDDALKALSGADDLAAHIDLLSNGERRLAELTASGDAAGAAALREQLSKAGAYLPADYETSAWADRIAKAHAWSEQRRALRAEVRRLQILKANVELPMSRGPYAEFMQDFWDDWGREAGLADETGNISWAKATGHEWTADQAVPADFYRLLASGDDDLAARLRELGVAGDSSAFIQPMSPMQMVAYMSRQSDGWWNKILIPKPDPGLIAKTVDVARQAFTLNVLMNPFTWMRSNLDEPLRALYQMGIVGRTGVDEQRVVGAAAAGVARVDKAFGEALGRAGAFGPRTGQEAAFINNMQMPYYMPSRGEPSAFVTSSKSLAETVPGTSRVSRAEMNSAAQQWLEGVLPGRPGWREWAEARLTGDRAVWVKYWEDGGGRLRAGASLESDLAAVGRVGIHEAYDGYNQVLDLLLSHTAGDRDQVAAALLKAWAKGEPINPAVLRQVRRVPALHVSDESPVGWLYDQFFGGPSNRHSQLVFRDFEDQTASILLQRHASRLLDAPKLAELFDVPVAVAEHWLAVGSAEVADAVARTGMVTRAMISHDASRIAATHAQHMAYQMGATTMLGKQLQKTFPFLKAQLDFAGYWWGELSQTTAFAFNPTLRHALRDVYDVSKAMPEGGIPFLTRTVDFASVPLNLRLGARIADFFGGLGTVEGDNDVLKKAVDDYTFLPTGGDDFWLTLSPGWAPLPSWALHMLPITESSDPGFGGWAIDAGAKLRGLLSAVDPAFDFYDKRAGNGGSDFLNFLLPTSRHTIRRLLSDLTRPALIATGISSRPDAYLAAPPGFAVANRTAIGEMLRADPYLAVGSLPFEEAAGKAVDGAYMSAAWSAFRGSLSEFTLRAGSFLLDAGDGEYLNLYESFVPTVDELWRAGYVSDEQHDTIRSLWEKWDRGEATYDEASQLADQLSGVLFGIPDPVQALIVVEHPELAGNLISSYMVTPDAPARYRSGDRLVGVPPGEEGRLLRERAKREGWLMPRDPSTLPAQAYQRFAQAFRSARDAVWSAAYGTERWSGTVAASRINDRYTPNTYATRLLVAIDVDPASVTSLGQLNDALALVSDKLSANVFASVPDTIRAAMAGTGYSDWMTATERNMDSQGYDQTDPTTWPETVRAEVRDGFRWAVDNGRISLADYQRYLAPRFGDMNYEPPIPPDLADVPVGSTKDTLRLPADPRDIEIIDGDTVRVAFDDGTSRRIRIIGVNAAEKNAWETQRAVDEGRTPDWLAQTTSLLRLIEGARTVDFVVFDPPRFATTQTLGGETRWLMWLYVDGQPIYDPGVFTSSTPTGAGLGGTGIP